MNDIQTLLLTTLFLGVGGGMIYFLKNNDNMDENEENDNPDNKNKSQKQKISKTGKLGDEDYDDYSDENSNDETNNDSVFNFKEPKNKAKTRRNKKKLTVSKRRY
jgi:hypothetical protein